MSLEMDAHVCRWPSWTRLVIAPPVALSVLLVTCLLAAPLVGWSSSVVRARIALGMEFLPAVLPLLWPCGDEIVQRVLGRYRTGRVTLKGGHEGILLDSRGLHEAIPGDAIRGVVSVATHDGPAVVVGTTTKEAARVLKVADRSLAEECVARLGGATPAGLRFVLYRPIWPPLALALFVARGALLPFVGWFVLPEIMSGRTRDAWIIACVMLMFFALWGFLTFFVAAGALILARYLHCIEVCIGDVDLSIFRHCLLLRDVRSVTVKGHDLLITGHTHDSEQIRTWRLRGRESFLAPELPLDVVAACIRMAVERAKARQPLTEDAVS